jgi:hypothetical protein
MVSRLPITTRPAHQEIAVSYLARLAALHDLPTDELWQQVSRPKTKGSPTRRLDGDLLATLANQPRARLERAVIELRTPEPDWLALRYEPQRGCRRCDARHPGGTVLHLLDHHHYVCTRHRIWIGPPDQTDHPQPNLDDLPEIVAAQHRHRRLIRRLGPAATFDAVLTGFLICAHRWNFADLAFPDLAFPGDAWTEWRRRAEHLIPPGTETDTFSTSRLFACTYPEAVALAELIGSLHWRRLVARGPDGQRAFATEIGRRLGLRDYRPAMIKDAVAHWMEQDCWRPPSPPNTDYRNLRTFGGPTFRKPSQDSDTKRRDNALWFSRHRRGGDSMLHHRTLNPVVIRDWSTKMEIFNGALEQTANTTLRLRKPLTTKDLLALATTEWIRTDPISSTWLNTATEPVDWQRRTGHDHPPADDHPCHTNDNVAATRERPSRVLYYLDVS